MSKYDELFLSTTDTITGIGAPISKKNRKVIYELKKRPKNKGLIIMVGSFKQAQKLEGWNKKANDFVKKYWPGNVTLVVNSDLAVRMPKNKELCKLLLSIGPIFMTSANISGENSLSFEDAKNNFKEITKHYNFGKGSGKPSKIIDVNTGKRLR